MCHEMKYWFELLLAFPLLLFLTVAVVFSAGKDLAAAGVLGAARVQLFGVLAAAKFLSDAGVQQLLGFV
jgi:hypothetical protein